MKNTPTLPPQPPAEIDGFERLTALIEKAEWLLDDLDTFRSIGRSALITLSQEEVEDWAPALIEQLDEIEKGLTQLGDWREQVSLRLLMLVGSFSNLTPHNAKSFLAMLPRHVISKKPSILVLETACRAVVENETFFSIAAVISALEEAEEKWSPIDINRLSIEMETARLVAAHEKVQAEFKAKVLDDLDAGGHTELAVALRADELHAVEADRALQNLRKIKAQQREEIAEARRRLRALSERLAFTKEKAQFEAEWYDGVVFATPLPVKPRKKTRF
jgi:hypothetical protein